MLQELETTMDQIQQALRVTDASYIIYKTQNYLVFNDAAGSLVQQSGLKRVMWKWQPLWCCASACAWCAPPGRSGRRNSVEKV